jgi:hypothetical protein
MGGNGWTVRSQRVATAARPLHNTTMRIVWNAGLPIPHTAIQVPPECVTAQESEMFIEHSQPPERNEYDSCDGCLHIYPGNAFGSTRSPCELERDPVVCDAKILVPSADCNEPAELPEGPQSNEPAEPVRAVTRTLERKSGRRRIGE